jgi:predicted transcriptional regulator
MSMTSIELQDEFEQPLSELAEKLNRSRNWIINEAVKYFWEHQSIEEQRWLETLPALASVKKGNSVAGEKVESWLASWGTPRSSHTPPSLRNISNDLINNCQIN